MRESHRGKIAEQRYGHHDGMSVYILDKKQSLVQALIFAYLNY